MFLQVVCLCGLRCLSCLIGSVGRQEPCVVSGRMSLRTASTKSLNV